MKNKVKVRYNNDLNKLENGVLSSVEQNLFFYICSRTREHGSELIEISFDSIRERSGFTAHGDLALISALKEVNRNLLTMNYEYVTENNIIIQGGLFTTFSIDPYQRILGIKINEDLSFLLNRLDGNFSEWELEEFTKIKSSYTKRIYRLCKEWRTVGKTPIYNVESFKDAIGLPESYENKKLVARILIPTEEELSKYFKNFKVIINRGESRGTPITGISFSFSPIMYLKTDAV